MILMFLTDFADQAVVLPTVVAIAALLAARGQWRGALIFLGVIGATFATVLALKLGFIGCRPLFRPLHLRSPSGHTAAATVLAAGLTALMTRDRRIIWGAAAASFALIAFSRVELGFHTKPEVLLGGLVGFAGAAAFARLMPPPSGGRRFSLLLAAALVAVLLHGVRLPAEIVIHHWADGMLSFIPACR
jgi:membrane-associated phospholipid phosphatase